MRLIDADELKRSLSVSSILGTHEALEQLIDSQPTAGEWIPCSEGLPDNEGYVLCTTVTKKGLRQVVKGYYSQAMAAWACGMNSNVVAWMKLPEPYEG